MRTVLQAVAAVSMIAFIVTWVFVGVRVADAESSQGAHRFRRAAPLVVISAVLAVACAAGALALEWVA